MIDRRLCRESGLVQVAGSDSMGDGRVGSVREGRRFLDAGLDDFDHVTQAMIAAQKRSVHNVVRPTPVAAPFVPEVLASEQVEPVVPGYRLVPFGGEAKAFDVWAASRFAVTTAAIDSARERSSRVSVLADGLYQCVTRGLGGVHLQTDSTNSAAVDIYRQSVDDVSRAYFAQDVADHGCGGLIDKGGVAEFVHGSGYDVCDCSKGCAAEADSLVVDLGIHALTVPQVCSAMRAAGAESAEVFLPYVPGMYDTDRGLFGSSGVGYSISGDVLRYHYSDASMGVLVASVAGMREWLTVKTLKVGLDDGGTEKTFGVRYNVEIVGTCGFYVRCRVMLDGYDRELKGFDRLSCVHMPRQLKSVDFSYEVCRPSRYGFSRVVHDGTGSVDDVMTRIGTMMRIAGFDCDIKKFDGLKVQRAWDKLFSLLENYVRSENGIVDYRVIEWTLDGAITAVDAIYRKILKHGYGSVWSRSLDHRSRGQVVYNPSDYVDVSIYHRHECKVEPGSRENSDTFTCSGKKVSTGLVSSLFSGFTVFSYTCERSV